MPNGVRAYDSERYRGEQVQADDESAQNRFPCVPVPVHRPATQGLAGQLQVYEQVLKKNEGRKKFVLHDGPPYQRSDPHRPCQTRSPRT
ncbi:MAG: hypothetical protein ACLU0O_00925 [Collinsella sp.]